MCFFSKRKEMLNNYVKSFCGINKLKTKIPLRDSRTNLSFVRQTSRIAQKSLSKEINFTYNETETVSAT